jgi:hypothetical protein
MRYLFQRIVHNEHGWAAPSLGRLKFTGDGAYLEDNGFGHEDWNFCLDKCADGHVHGYMYYRPIDTKGPFNILFATYDKGEGWALSGFYKNATFDEDGATFRRQVLRRRAQELKALDAAKSLGGEYRGKSIEQIANQLKEEAQYYRWRVLPNNVHRMQEPLRLPVSLTSRFGAYFTRPTELEKGAWRGGERNQENVFSFTRHGHTSWTGDACPHLLSQDKRYGYASRTLTSASATGDSAPRLLPVLPGTNRH